MRRLVFYDQDGSRTFFHGTTGKWLSNRGARRRLRKRRTKKSRGIIPRPFPLRRISDQDGSRTFFHGTTGKWLSNRGARRRLRKRRTKKSRGIIPRPFPLRRISDQ